MEQVRKTGIPLSLALMTLAPFACLQALGDDYEVSPNTAAGNAAPAGGAGGTGGNGGGDGGTGTGGHAPICVLGTAEGCGSDQKCTVLDVSTGALGCIAAGQRPVDAACDLDEQCVVGTICDPYSGVCLGLCGGELPSCPGAGDCFPGIFEGEAVPGLFICTTGCDPLTQEPCDHSYGQLTCAWWGGSTFQCAVNKTNGALGEACAGLPHEECAPGLVCLDLGEGGLCYSWCVVGGGSNCPNQVCVPGPEPLVQAGIEYGVCPL